MNELQKLYGVLVRDGYFTKSFEEFQTKWQDPAYKQKVYSIASRDGLYTKSEDEFMSKYSETQAAKEPLKKKESTDLASKSGKPTLASSSKRRFEGVTEEPISQKKFRTDDYIDQVQNAKKQPQPKTTVTKNQYTPKVEEQKFDVLTTQEANEMMAQDFGKKEFDLYSQISEIDPSVFSQGEAASVKYLNDKFKGSGFVFEETGVGNSVKIKSTLNDGFGTVVNEKVIDLPTKEITPFGLVQTKTQNEARDEVAQFMNQAFLKKSEKEFLNNEVKDYGQLVKLAAKNPYKYGESFLNQHDTEKWIDKQYLDLVNEGKNIKTEQERLNKQIQDYKQSGVYNEETERLIRNMSTNLQNQVEANTKKYNELQDITAALPKAAAVYYQNKEKEGNTLGIVTRSLASGMMNLEKALITTAADVAPLIIPSEYIIPEVQQVRLKASGMTDAEIKDYASKQLRQGIVSEALEGAKDLYSLGTTDEYMQSKDRNDIEKTAAFLAESIGTAISGGGNPLLTKAAFFAQSYNAIEDEMNSPEFNSLSQMEKKIMSVPYGLVIGALDKLGFDVATKVSSMPIVNNLITNTIAKAFTNLPKNASIEMMDKAISESLKATMAKTGLEIVGGALVEGATEGAQSLAEYTMKDIYNNVISDKDVFKDVVDITTKEGFNKALNAAKEETYYGTLGGLIMSGGSQALKSISEGFNQGNEEFQFFDNIISDPNLRSLIQTDIKTKITSGELTKAQAAEQIDAINKSASILNAIPNDIDTEGKKESYNLILERNKLDKQKEGKDPNLVKPITDRINEINNRLQEISIQNAVQEQSTGEVPVQSETGVSGEVAQGVPGTEAQKPTGEIVTEEVKVEEPKGEQPQAEVTQEVVLSDAQKQAYEKLSDEDKKTVDELINDESYERSIGAKEVTDEGSLEDQINKSAISFEDTLNKALNVSQPKETISEDTEVFTFGDSKYDINKANDIISKESLKPIDVSVDVLPKMSYSFISVDENTVKNADITKPVIIAKTKDGLLLIDGHHRVRKAIQENQPIKAFVLNEDQTSQVTGQPIVQPAVQETVQETVQAEPTVKIETIEVQEVPQVEQTLNDLTQQNNVLTQNDFTAAKIRNVGKEKIVAQIEKAAKATAKVLPKVKFIVHTTPESFVKATKEMNGRLSEGGLYDQQTGEIHINLQKASNRTVAHEVFHALILSRVSSDIEAQRLTKAMIGAVRKSLKKAEGTAELISHLEDFESDYDENVKNEERLAELFAVLADNYKQLPPASKNIIIRFLNRLAKIFGLKEMTDREAIDFMNTLSRKVETGDEIQASELGQQKEGKVAVRKQIVGEIGAERLDQNENSNLRMNNLEVAKQMKDAGRTPKEIRNLTEWELGSEGKWRYETVDNLPFFKDTVRIVKKLQKEEGIQYGMDLPANAIIPDELLKMYPELNDYRFDFETGNENQGNIDTDEKRITVNIGNNPIETVRTLLHEIQHAIQEIEGFDSGANAQQILDDFLAKDNALKNKINRLKKYSPDSPLLDAVRNERKAFIDNFSTVNKNNEKVLDKLNLYMRKAGEIEARNVETRMNMTAEQRRNTLLTETEDVKDRQIIETAPRKFAVRKQKGLINLTDQEAMKYARAGVENKYDAQAIKQIGLQGTKFDKKSILERIQKEFDGLVKNTTDYIFREDSPAIDQAIQNEIDTMVDQGYSNAQIENAKRAFSPGRERDNVINEYRRAQVETANQWENYLGQSDYPASFKYLMLDAVLTNNYDLKTDRYQKRTGKTIRNFTPFDAGTLAELYMSDSNELLKDYVRIQADNSANIVESAAFSSTKDGKWIKFDGGSNVGEQELKDNANKLSQLVQNTYWCTKTNALSQLRDGDFYVYVTENKQGDFDPRIAVRMNGDKVGEVRGNASSKQDLEADMLPIADTFLREKIPNDSGKKWLDSIAYNTKVKDLNEKIDNKVLDMDDVYEYIDILKDKDKFSVDYGENGLVQTLKSKFRNAKFSFGVSDWQGGIKDDTLLLLAPNDIYTFMFRNNEETKNVKVIIGNVNIYDDFDGGKVKAITGNVEFEDSSVKEIKSIESIGGRVRFRNSEIKDLGSIESIGGDVSFRNSEVRYLGNLKSIGGRAVFRDSEIRSLENLEYIGGRADFYDSFVEDLGSLKEIGGDADFENSEIIYLDGLKKIGGNANFNYSDVESLGALESIGGHADFANSKIESLGRLKEIGGNAIFHDSNVKDLGDLESIRFGVWFNDKIKDLGKLKPVARGRASFGGNTELEKQYKERQKRQFAVRKQKTTGPNRIVENGIKAGKTDAQIRQEGKAAGFTNKEMTEALSKYYTKEQGVFMKSGTKGFVSRFVNGAKRFKQQYLTSKGLLPKIGFFFKEKMEGFISSEANRAAKVAKKFGVLFDKFTGDKDLLLKAFDKALRGDKSIQLPAGFAALANEMRNHIDRLSQMLIDSGAVDADMADTIRNNMGTYITRSYEIFDNKNFRQKVGEQELQAAKNFLRTQPGMLGLAQAEASRTGVTVDEALDVLVDNKIDEYFADAETGALVKGSKLGSKDLSTLKERKEIPEQIRMLMGEYSDPAMNYARTVLNIASLAARHQFLTQVKEAGMGKFFFEKNDSQRPKGFDTEIAPQGSDTMSPLNGLMTTPEIAEAFGIYEGQKGEDSWAQQAIKIYYKAMGLVKWLKTIASVSTHARNIFSNFTFVGVNGHSLVEIGKAIKVVAQDLKTMSKPEVEAKIDEYIKAGIMRQGAGINEIKDMFKDADMDDFLERRLSMRQPKGVMGKIKQVISSKSYRLKTAMEDLYQAEDDMFKIAAYETEMNRYADALYNKSKDQLTKEEKEKVSDIAANNVKNTYPTYSRIPEGIKKLRRFPLFIGSFISFQAESYRTAYNTIELAKNELSSDNEKIRKIGGKRIAGAATYLTAKTAILSYLGYAAGTGIGGLLGALFDDDDEKKKEKDVRSFLPPWSQNSDLIILKAADGEIDYIDFSASDAHGGINKALNAFLKGDDLLDSFKESTLELVGQFQGPDILTNLAIQLKGNENDFGKPIYNEEDTFAEKTDKILDYVYKVVEPGTITSIRKAATSEQSLGQIAFGDATGLKVRKVDVKDQFGYKLPEFDESFKDIRKIYNSEYYKSVDLSEDPKATDKDIKEQDKKTEEALIRANEKYAEKAKELMDLINSANKLGVDYDQLIDQLESIKSTMGKARIREMENGGEEFIEEKRY